MSHRTRFGVILCTLLAPALLGGCQVLDELNLGRPSLALQGVGLNEFGLQSSTIVFDVEVRNPYGVPLPLIDCSYALASGGAPFLDGSMPLEGSVPARGARTISLPVRVDYLGLLGVLGSARPGRSIPWDAELAFAVDLPAGERLSLPFRSSGALPVPAVPKVDLASVRWKEIGLAGASGTVVLSLENPNDFGFDLSALGLGLELGGREVAQLAAQPGTAVTAGGTTTIELPLSLSTASLGLGLLDALRGDSANYRLRGELDIGTPHGPLTIPLDRAGRTLLGGG